ncbi:MAG: DUF4383 domain-containing protein [Candidatus Dormibacteria bacterium]
MNPVKAFAGVFGAVYLLVGVVGFAVTGASQQTHQLLGLFDLNALHNVVHIAIGALGLAAYAGGVSVARSYALGLAVVYAVVAVAGFLPQQFLGIIPIGGADIALHTGTAVVALAAFMASRQPTVRTA